MAHHGNESVFNSRDFSKGNKQIPSKGTLVDLGDAMHAAKQKSLSNIPAGYTYLGQFIAHDMIRTQGAENFSLEATARAQAINTTTQALDLSSVYFSSNNLDNPAIDEVSGKFRLGKSLLANGKPHGDEDLPRDPITKQAFIADSRNDENLILSQLHLAFLKHHNYLVNRIKKGDPESKFKKAKRKNRAAFQYIVVNDFLKTLLKDDIWELYFSRNISAVAQHFDCCESDIEKVRDNPIFYQSCLPLEFTTAAFKFGHAMVRSSYTLQYNYPNKAKSFTLHELFQYTGRGKLNGHDFLPADAQVDFRKLFYKNANTTEKAAVISPVISINLPMGNWPENQLAVRNLGRQMIAQTPCAQECIKKIADSSLPEKLKQNVRLLSDEQLNPKLHFSSSDGKQSHENILDRVGASKDITQHTPLWYYCLQECYLDRKKNTQQPSPRLGDAKLGSLTSLIIAESFYQVLKQKNIHFDDEQPIQSMLDIIIRLKKEQ